MRIAVVFSLICLCLIACDKDNRSAKKLEGIWYLDTWEWDGIDTLEIPGDTILRIDSTDTLGIWTFHRCNLKKELSGCDGTHNQFLGMLPFNFDWSISEKETVFSFVKPTGSGLQESNFEGDWTIVSFEKDYFEIESDSCVTCLLRGPNRLKFVLKGEP